MKMNFTLLARLYIYVTTLVVFLSGGSLAIAAPISNSIMGFNGENLAANTQGVCSAGFLISPGNTTPFPVECAFHETLLAPEDYRTARLWSYANEKGSVHIGLDGREFPFGVFTEFPNGAADHDKINVSLSWWLNFTQDSAAASPEMGFTLNPGFIQHQIYSTAGSNLRFENRPLTSSDFRVAIDIRQFYDCSTGSEIFSGASEGCAAYLPIDEFISTAQLSGYTNITVYRYKRYCESSVCEVSGGANDPVWPNEPQEDEGGGRLWNSQRYRGVLSPSELRSGEKAQVRYQLDMRGVASNDGRGSWGKLSDPLDPQDLLDPESAPILEADGIIPTEPGELNACSVLTDVDRFRLETEDTIHDTSTGLIWQRCPLNFTFESGACVADPSSEQQLDWIETIAAANNSSLGGHSDWQLANAKQLETLVGPCRPATIDYLVFPSTPAEPFWTSTPTRENRAWTVHFGTGDMQTMATEQPAYARLVRRSDAPAVRTKPRLRADFGRVVEPDPGSVAQITMPIVLSRAADSDVTLDYELRSGSALAGDDFTLHSGSLTIPAGALSTSVEVEVSGDIEPERHEYFFMELSNPSSNVSMERHVSLGRIVDDDRVYVQVPRVPLQLPEGSAGVAATVDIPITLSQPAKEPISVDYTALDDSAVGGTDFVAASGSVSFGVGEIEQTITLNSIANDTIEDDRNLLVRIDGVIGASFRSGFDEKEVYIRLVDDDGVLAQSTGLNDSGPTECEPDCPPIDGLDHTTGRDVLVDDDNNGIDGFAFTKLDGAGQPLLDQQASYGIEPWDCVADEVTGLVWEVKTARSTSNPVDNIRHAGSTFSWFNSTGVRSNGIVGVENAGSCDGGVDCDTEKYVAAINAQQLCGFSDWRLPSVDELSNVVYYAGSFFGPTLDTDYFPNQEIGASNFVRGTWTGTPVVRLDDYVFLYNSLGVSQAQAGTSFLGSTATRYVRLVRGEQR